MSGHQIVLKNKKDNEFAKAFYNSTAWLECRKEIVKSYDIGIDLANGKDKTVLTPINPPIK